MVAELMPGILINRLVRSLVVLKEMMKTAKKPMMVKMSWVIWHVPRSMTPILLNRLAVAGTRMVMNIISRMARMVQRTLFFVVATRLPRP